MLEAESYTGELLGEQKIKESAGRLIKAFSTLKMNFGYIFVEFGTPIDYRKYQDMVAP